MRLQRALKVGYHPSTLSMWRNYIPFIALREAVAYLYNDTYRKGRSSQYTYENVCIVPGGRAGLSRVAAVIGDVYTVSQVEPRRLPT